MRATSRWLRRRYGEWRIAGRRAEVEALLAEHLGQPVSLAVTGARGRDSIYLVTGAASTLGVLRLINPFLRRKPLPSGLPFVSLDGAARLRREWCCYATGHRAGLTPRPLWRTADAMLCDYRPDARLSQRLFSQPSAFWSLMCAATRALRALHELGLTHMDVCLANILADQALTRFTFIDFEYGPAPELSAPQQKAYDHLRLVESSIKFLPPGLSHRCGDWLRVLDQTLDAETRAADLKPLAPALERLLRDPEIGAALRSMFAGAGRAAPSRGAR